MGFKINGKVWEETKVGGSERLQIGGHKCVIKKITLGKSKSMKDQFVVEFDTTNEDSQPNYFMNRYMEYGTWSGRHLITAGNEYFIKNIKSLRTAVEDSNEGFSGGHTEGGEEVFDFEKYNNVKVGIVFREEEFRKQDGTLGVSVKPFYFCSYDKTDEQKLPQKKPLKVEIAAFSPAAGANGQEGFLQVPDGLADEGLPFM